MGNEESSGVDTGETNLQTQDSDHLWTIFHREEEEEGVSVFTHVPGRGSQSDLCRTGMEVRLIILGNQRTQKEMFICIGGLRPCRACKGSAA